MNTVEKVLTIECALLASGILVVIFLIMYVFKKKKVGTNEDVKTDNLEKNYITLPPTWTTVVEMQRHVEEVFDHDMTNSKSTDECVVIDETRNMANIGRLYFSLKYELQRSVLTVKLIKGENLPNISKNGNKAYVHVQIICHQGEGQRSLVVKGSRLYQKTYTFHLQPKDFLSHVIYFEVSRFDRFSRKYDVAHVVVALSELQADIVELSREKLFAKDIIRNWNMTRKRRYPSDPERLENDDKTGISPLQRDIKVRHRKAKILWSKLGRAVRSGLFDERWFNGSESLQWDPFLIVHRYEFPGNVVPPTSVAGSSRYKSVSQTVVASRSSIFAPSEQRVEQRKEKNTDWHSAGFPSPSESQLSCSEGEPSSSHSPTKLKANQEFYRLVHSPSLMRKGQLTSWSIPETFRLPPQPQRTSHMRTVVFHSVSAIHQKHHDRLHKLTSLSTSYRERILRKSRRDVTVHKGRITGQISLHKSLYLGKGTHHSSESVGIERTRKRQRKTTMS